jgi:uncharacterized protein YegL
MDEQAGINEQAGIRRQEDRSILINFVLDKSGSMEMIREATIAGFNQFLRDQQEEGGAASLTLTLFDTHFSTVITALPLPQVRPLNMRTYIPGGGTALYDAIAQTMALTDRYVAVHKPDQVLFVIMTDGEENSSHEFTREQIMRMIEDRQRTADYEFIYLGANQDAYQVGNGIGIRGGRALDYAASPAATQATMARVSANVKSHRRLGEKTLKSHVFFSPEMEDLGRESWDVYKTRRDSEAAGGSTGGAGAGDSAGARSADAGAEGAEGQEA